MPAGPALSSTLTKETDSMIVLGIDAHKRSHTVVVVDDVGRKLAERTIGTTTADHLAMLTWVEKFDGSVSGLLRTCRHLARRLERDLLDAGEPIVRVPPKNDGPGP